MPFLRRQSVEELFVVDIVVHGFFVPRLLGSQALQLYVYRFDFSLPGLLVFDLQLGLQLCIELRLLILVDVLLEVLIVLLQHLETLLQGLLLLERHLLQLCDLCLDDPVCLGHQEHFLLLLEQRYHCLLGHALLSLLLPLVDNIQSVGYNVPFFLAVGRPRDKLFIHGGLKVLLWIALQP